MKYLLIILMFIFISCGEDKKEDFCSNHVCEICESSIDVFYNNDKKLISCVEECRGFIQYYRDFNGNTSDKCMLFISEKNNSCEITDFYGSYCSDFLNINEE